MLSYRIDCDDRIVAVSDEWTSFALANDGVRVMPADVVGRVIWDLIPAAEVLYAPLLYAVRGQQKTLRVRLRCDSPERRRLLEMQFVPVPLLGVEFRTQEVAWQPRDLVRLGAPSAGGDLLRICSWCNRIEAGGHWYEAEEAMAQLGGLERAALPAVTHGMCPDCAWAVKNTADGNETEAWPVLPQLAGDRSR